MKPPIQHCAGLKRKTPVKVTGVVNEKLSG
jgi:hypothetical protein